MWYDIPERIVYYNYAPPIIFKNIMGPIHQNLPVIQFRDNAKVEILTFCTITGDLAGESCETTAYGWYKPSNIPDVCNGDHDVNKTEEDQEAEREDDEDEDDRDRDRDHRDDDEDDDD